MRVRESCSELGSLNLLGERKGSSCLYREFVDENRKGKEKLEKRKNGEKREVEEEKEEKEC